MMVKLLKPLGKVKTPDGIGVLLGRDAKPEQDTITIDGEPRVMVAVQFCDKQMRGGVSFYDVSLVEPLNE